MVSLLGIVFSYLPCLITETLVHNQLNVGHFFPRGWLEINLVGDFVTCASCIFCALFCLWDAKFLFQRVPGCNIVADLSIKIVFSAVILLLAHPASFAHNFVSGMHILARPHDTSSRSLAFRPLHHG